MKTNQTGHLAQIYSGTPARNLPFLPSESHCLLALSKSVVSSWRFMDILSSMSLALMVVQQGWLQVDALAKLISTLVIFIQKPLFSTILFDYVPVS
jgi:hypothetical protein